ncbi:MAG: hypothetical protein JRE71_11350 [Deltaproteobacteria bacterium]|nr:hypothetical protein [Deltaproteobacteria bacterium]
MLPGASLELRHFDVSGGATTGMGGNILNEGTLILSDSIIQNGQADAGGGGIASTGSLVLDRSLVLSNAGVGRGGGLLLLSGSTTTIRASTIEGNTVSADASGEADGAGLYSEGMVTVENTTLSGNLAARDGGGAFLSSGSASIDFSTFAENAAAGTGSALAGAITPQVHGTLIAGSCGGALGSIGGNLESPGNSCQLTGLADQVAVAPGALALAALDSNDGPTPTHALLSGSVAIDAALAAGCLPMDQRDAPRPERNGTSCDIGAYEWTKVGLSGIQKIAEQGTPDPRGSGTLKNFEMVALTQGDVAFIGLDSNDERNLYLFDGSMIEYVAGASTPVPGGIGTFNFSPRSFLFSELAADSGSFALAYPAPGGFLPPPDFGLYLFSAGQSIERCVGVGDVLPDGGTYSNNTGLLQFDIDGQNVVFYDQGLFSCGAGGLAQLMERIKTLPNGDSITRSVTGELRSEGGSILFHGNRRPRTGVPIVREDGLFEYDAVADIPILVLDIPFPLEPQVTSIHRHNFENYVASAFLTQWGTLIPGGIYSDASGSFVQTDAISANLNGVITFVDGIAFVGVAGEPNLFGPSPSDVPIGCLGGIEENASIATDLGGLLEVLIKTGSTFDQKSVLCVISGRDFSDGQQMAFAVYFDDGSNALYTAMVPEPSIVSALAWGAFLLGTFGRQRHSRSHSRA